MTPPAQFITGLFETHLNVRSLERSMEFYQRTLGLELGILSPERRLAIFWIGPRGKAKLGLWEKPPGEILSQHYAFEVSLSNLEGAIGALMARGIEILDFDRKPTRVPVVFGWMPAASFYFYDPDGHLLEMLAMLTDPPRPEVGVIPLDQWKRLVQASHDLNEKP